MKKRSKIPKRFKKFNRMPFFELASYVKMNFNYELQFDKDTRYYQAFNYFGKCVVQCDSPDMLIYWLSIFN